MRGWGVGVRVNLPHHSRAVNFYVVATSISTRMFALFDSLSPSI